MSFEWRIFVGYPVVGHLDERAAKVGRGGRVLREEAVEDGIERGGNGVQGLDPTGSSKRMPSSGWMMPGRNRYTALNGNLRNAFSVRPLIRAHMIRPCSLLSVPAPET